MLFTAATWAPILRLYCERADVSRFSDENGSFLPPQSIVLGFARSDVPSAFGIRTSIVRSPDRSDLHMIDEGGVVPARRIQAKELDGICT